MIVGRGLLASAFDAQAIETLEATLFASGVSNSSEINPLAYVREQQLLEERLAAAKGAFVYFSTCSIEDPDRGSGQYARHKVRMEQLVADRGGRYLILRLPQVVGRTGNPHNLINFLTDRLRNGEPIPMWSGAVRCLIDVEHVAAITMRLLQDGAHEQLRASLAPPEVISMPALVDVMESILGLHARREIVDRTGGTQPDATLMAQVAPTLGIDVSPGYTRRLLEKYHRHDNAN
jgi:nucleoside-diphosphate-sugar epimerase